MSSCINLIKPNFRKPWKKVNWSQIFEGNFSTLPAEFEQVLVAFFSPENQCFRTVGYWNRTLTDDVVFTINCPKDKGLKQYAQEEILAWKPQIKNQRSTKCSSMKI